MSPDRANTLQHQARVVACVDDRRDARIERGDGRELRAQVHVDRAAVRAQLFGDHVDVGEQIIDVGH